MKCEDCKWWETPDKDKEAICRRYAPTITEAMCPGYLGLPIGDSISPTRRIFPMTNHLDWCGEFIPK